MGWIDCEIYVWMFFSQAGLILSLMLDVLLRSR
jgi:hypothetical protein